MHQLLIQQDAREDLQAIKAAGDMRSYGILLAFLHQARSDQQILDSLSDDFFGVESSGNYDVKKWVAQQRQRRDLWRVRLRDAKGLTVPYRILYTTDQANCRYFVLAIMPRNVNYDEHHPRIRRVLDICDHLQRTTG